MEVSDKKYFVQFGGAMAAYAVLLIGAIFLINAGEDEWWRFVVAPLPMIPLVFALFAFVGRFRRMDELQRRIQLEALAFGFGGTALLTFSYGFMQTVGFPQISWFFIWPVMAILWSLGIFVANRRYK